MIKLLFFTLLFATSLFAKVLYVNYNTVPQRVIKGQIFPVTLKTLSTVSQFKDIQYHFFNAKGTRVLDSRPQRVKKGRFYFDTFHLLATQTNAKLPDVKISLLANHQYPSTIVQGAPLNVIALNPQSDFSHIVANDLQLQKYKTTSFDASHNIVVFVLKANNAKIRQMHFNNVTKQGFESVKGSYRNSLVTYFIVINKRVEYFKFSYFNLLQNRYVTIKIPIVVVDDSVTTQSDLKPRDESHDKIKMYIALAITILGLLLAVWKRKYIYIIFILIPLGYTIYLAVPQKDICIKKGANIYLLPVYNSTIFETTQTTYHLTKEGSVKNFTKVKLQNNKIGWVKNEDICTH